jgi:hypothetical protein
MGKSEQIRWTGVGANQILTLPDNILKIYGRTDILASVSFFRQNDEMSVWSIRMLENKRRLINYP